ncbi:unnamed protein product [Urochloa humidicola]
MCSGRRRVSPHGHGGAARREAGTAARADATRAAVCSQWRREVDAGGVQGGVWCVWPCEAAKGGAARAGWGGTASSLLQEGWPRGGCCGRARGGPAARWIGGGCGDMVEPKTRTRVGASPAASTPASAPPPGSRILPPPSRPPQPPSSFFVVSVLDGEDCASGGALCHVFPEPFAGDEDPPDPVPVLHRGHAGSAQCARRHRAVLGAGVGAEIFDYPG